MPSSNSSVSSVPAVLSVVSATAAAMLLFQGRRRSAKGEGKRDSSSVATEPTVLSDNDYSHHNYEDIPATLESIKTAFGEAAVPNAEFVDLLKRKLDAYNYGSTTLLATSLCCDEVNRPLVEDLEREFGQSFSMGGLAGFAFGGVTSFGAMASHIPDDGSTLVVYGPHVGVDTHGKVGTVERRGRKNGGACCGSATAAAGYVHECFHNNCSNKIPSSSATNNLLSDPLDAQQQFVNQLLMPYGKQLENACDKNSEVPKALFDANNNLMQRIVAKACGKVGCNGKIALVGGIQINTPEGMSDYFLPLCFEIRNNKGDLLEDFLAQRRAIKPTVETISRCFPKAVTNHTLVSRAQAKLSEYGYGESTLLATSLCCDEVNKPLIDEFTAVYGNSFNMGGLAGFAFGGVTSFGAMCSHIPDDGSCLLVYGPHVGIDSNGTVGTVDRRGRKSGGACCGSAAAAANHVANCAANSKAEPPTDALDAQQTFVNNMLLPQADRLSKAQEKMVELPLALYDAQTELIQKIVAKGCSKVAGDGKIALLGGVQINTPDGMWDYFLPLSFDILNNRGEVLANLLWE